MNAPDRSGLVMRLPVAGGGLEPYALREPRAFPQRPARAFTRVAYSASGAKAEKASGSDKPTTASVRSRAGGIIRSDVNACSIDRMMPAWLSTIVPSQSKTTNLMQLF